MPGVGLEPTSRYRQRILSPPCLPFHHPGDIAAAGTLNATTASSGRLKSNASHGLFIGLCARATALRMCHYPMPIRSSEVREDDRARVSGTGTCDGEGARARSGAWVTGRRWQHGARACERVRAPAAGPWTCHLPIAPTRPSERRDDRARVSRTGTGTCDGEGARARSGAWVTGLRGRTPARCVHGCCAASIP
jgi:hypothetical protein